MSGHPIASIVADGIKVPKGGFRDYIAARVPVVLETASQIQSMDLPGTLAVILGRVMFYYDATDGSSAHNGTTVLVSLDGRRYKGSASLPAGSVTNTELAAGAAVANIGFTPLQQGGGTGQLGNKLRIGWLGSTLGLQVDSTNFGAVWPIATVGNVRVDTASQGLTSTEKANARANLDLGNAALATMGVAGGVATLDSYGFVPSSQLPSHIDDIIDYASVSAFPGTGAKNKIYYAVDVEKQYRWTGSVYAEIIPAPGTTDALTEGSTNLYHTAARVLAALAANATTARANLGLDSAALKSEAFFRDASNLNAGTVPEGRLPVRFTTSELVVNADNYKSTVGLGYIDTGAGGVNAPAAGAWWLTYEGNANYGWQFATDPFGSGVRWQRKNNAGFGAWERDYKGAAQLDARYLNADNLNAGTVPDARLPARFTGSTDQVGDANSYRKNGGTGLLIPPHTNGPTAAYWHLAYVGDDTNGRQYACFPVTFETYVRSYTSGTWSAWQRVRETEAELDERYLNASNLNAGKIAGERLPEYLYPTGSGVFPQVASPTDTNTFGGFYYEGTAITGGTAYFNIFHMGDRNTSAWRYAHEVVSGVTYLSKDTAVAGPGPWNRIYQTREEIGGLFNAGSNITITYNGGTGKYDISATGTLGGTTAASSVTFSPAGNIASTSVQGAIEELDAEKTTLAATDARYLRKTSSGEISTADSASIDHSGSAASASANATVVNQMLADIKAAGGGILRLSRGAIALPSLAELTNTHIAIEGYGERISTLIMTGTTGNLFTITQGSQGYRTHLRKMSVLKHSDGNTAGAAFRVSYPEEMDGPNDTIKAENIECGGSGTGFGALLVPINAWNVTLRDLFGKGPQDTTNVMQALVYFQGKCTVSDLSGMRCAWADALLRFEGNKFSEGIRANKLHAVATNYLFRGDGANDAPGLYISDSHGETFKFGIYALNYTQVQLHQVHLYKRITSTQNWFGVWREAAGYGGDSMTISHMMINGFKGAAAGGSATAIFCDDVNGISGRGNLFEDCDVGFNGNDTCTGRVDFVHRNVTTPSMGSANVTVDAHSAS